MIPQKQFRRLVALLRKEFPTKLRVEVRRRSRLGYMGSYIQRRRKTVGPRGGVSYPYVHLIVVHSLEGAETLIHEWTHALRREQDSAAKHDAAFWQIYGRMYRTYIDL